MKSQAITLQRYDADEGKVFDWSDLAAHQTTDEETGEIIQEHLYAKTLFLALGDDIENYIEIDWTV